LLAELERRFSVTLNLFQNPVLRRAQPRQQRLKRIYSA